MDHVYIRLDGQEPTQQELNSHLEQMRKYAYDLQLQLFPDPDEELRKDLLRKSFESAEGQPRVLSANQFLGPWFSSPEFLAEVLGL